MPNEVEQSNPNDKIILEHIAQQDTKLSSLEEKLTKVISFNNTLLNSKVEPVNSAPVDKEQRMSKLRDKLLGGLK